MNVADIMTRKPATISHDSTLAVALEIMERVDCRHLPVLSADSHLVGILSDRDCRLALNAPNILRERWQDEEVIKKILNHLGLWERKARPPPKTSVPQPNAHIDKSDSQVPPCEDYLYCDPEYPIEEYAS